MFELFEKDLATIMATLKTKGKRFTEEELWRMSEGLIAALAFLFAVVDG